MDIQRSGKRLARSWIGCHSHRMITRRTFVLSPISLAGLCIGSNLVPVSKLMQDGPIATLDDDDFDINGFYIAVVREADGSVTLSELIDNKLKARESFAINDSAGILRFIDEVGLGRLRFIDWHGTSDTADIIRVHELEIVWSDGALQPSLASHFRECADLLSCAVGPEVT